MVSLIARPRAYLMETTRYGATDDDDVECLTLEMDFPVNADPRMSACDHAIAAARHALSIFKPSDRSLRVPDQRLPAQLDGWVLYRDWVRYDVRRERQTPHIRVEVPVEREVTDADFSRIEGALLGSGYEMHRGRIVRCGVDLCYRETICILDREGNDTLPNGWGVSLDDRWVCTADHQGQRIKLRE